MTDYNDPIDKEIADSKHMGIFKKVGYSALAVTLGSFMLMTWFANLDSPVALHTIDVELEHYDALTGEILTENKQVNATAAWFDGEKYAFKEITESKFRYQNPESEGVYVSIGKPENITEIHIMLKGIEPYVVSFNRANGSQLFYDDYDGDGRKEVMLTVKITDINYRAIKMTGMAPELQIRVPWYNEQFP